MREGRARRRRPAPRSSACPRCSARPTSARRRTTRTSTWPSRCRGRPPRPCGRAAREAGVGRGRPIFERRAPGVYHNTRGRSSTPTARSPGLYRKMHIPDDPLFYEKFYFTPGDLGFRAFDAQPGRDRHPHLLGPVVPRGARGSPRCAAPRSSSTRPPSAGTRARRPSTAPQQRAAWQTIQRAHAIANGVYVAAVNRVGHEKPAEGGDGLEFWGTSLRRRPVRAS